LYNLKKKKHARFKKQKFVGGENEFFLGLWHFADF
jgi:hypothetical protein